MDNPPVNLSGIAIGDGTITSTEAFNQLPVVTVLETYPQIIGYDPQVFEYFQTQCVRDSLMCSRNAHLFFRSELCGYNLTLKYPQPEHFPTLNAPTPPGIPSDTYDAKLTKKRSILDVQEQLVAKLRKREGAPLEHGERLRAHDMWKRNLAGRANGTIDPWYQCDLYDEMLDYALNFTFPWCTYLLFPLALSSPTFFLYSINP